MLIFKNLRLSCRECNQTSQKGTCVVRRTEGRTDGLGVTAGKLVAWRQKKP